MSYFLNLEDDCLVLYADILGFSDMIEENKDTSREIDNRNVGDLIDLFSGNILERDGVKYLENHYILFDRYFPNEDFESKGLKISRNSDGIVLSAHKDKIDEFIITIFEMIQFFYNLNFLLRGAITFGKHFQGNNFWGPAYNKAVNYEKTEAIYPRIIIDTEDFQKINISNNKKYFVTAKDNAKYLYFDYFNYLINNFELKEKHGLLVYLLNYSYLIKKNIDKYRLYKNALLKNQWLSLELIKVIKKNADNIDNFLLTEIIIDFENSNIRVNDHSYYINILY